MGRQVGTDPQPYPPLPLMLDEQVIQHQPDQAALTERYVDDCVRFMRGNRDRPFFLYFAHMYVHLPIYASQRFLNGSRNGSYGAGVACVDWSVRVILHELKQLGLDDNGARCTHGGSNGALRGRKTQTWEGGQRVPCILRFPGRIKPGQVSGEIASGMDFLPTFAELAGAALPDHTIDGKSITCLFDGAGRSPHDAFFYMHLNRLEAVRSGRWKLHVAKGEQPMLELYDLIEDIGESRNVAADHPQIVADLQEKLAMYRQDLGDELTNEPGSGCRPIGRVPAGRTLTTYDPDHPYFAAEYDLSDRG